MTSAALPRRPCGAQREREQAITLAAWRPQPHTANVSNQSLHPEFQTESWLDNAFNFHNFMLHFKSDKQLLISNGNRYLHRTGVCHHTLARRSFGAFTGASYFANGSLRNLIVRRRLAIGACDVAVVLQSAVSRRAVARS